MSHKIQCLARWAFLWPRTLKVIYRKRGSQSYCFYHCALPCRVTAINIWCLQEGLLLFLENEQYSLLTSQNSFLTKLKEECCMLAKKLEQISQKSRWVILFMQYFQSTVYVNAVIFFLRQHFHYFIV